MSFEYGREDDNPGEDRPWERLEYSREVYERLRQGYEAIAEGLREIPPLDSTLARRLSYNPNLHPDIAVALSHSEDIGTYLAERWRREGIERNEFDMPTFGPYSIATISIASYYGEGVYSGNHYYPSHNPQWDGESKSDYVNATKEATLPYGIDCNDIMRLARSEYWVWHHHEDARTMQLVPVEIHDNVYHRGGASFVEARRRGNRN